jgi:ribosomal-protein-alanine N-acetyltransferase
MPAPSTPILTERLLLRPYEAADALGFFTVLDANRDRLLASFPDRLQAVATLADAQRQLAAFASDWRTGRFYVFGIWQRATAAYLGDICLMPQQASQAEIGYYLAAEAEGQGYAREALGAVVGFGREVVGAQRLLIRCFADNTRGQAVARALGFAPEIAPALPKTLPWFRRPFRESPPEHLDILHFVRPA